MCLRTKRIKSFARTKVKWIAAGTCKKANTINIYCVSPGFFRQNYCLNFLQGNRAGTHNLVTAQFPTADKIQTAR
jgi:hypothetical protein